MADAGFAGAKLDFRGHANLGGLGYVHATSDGSSNADASRGCICSAGAASAASAATKTSATATYTDAAST